MKSRSRPSRRYSSDPRLSEAESRRFTAAIDRALELQINSGYSGLILRGVFQFAGWLVIARAIHIHELSALLVLAPWVLEFLFLTWLGPVLARFVIDDPIFRKISGSWWLALLWSAILLVPLLSVVLFQSGFNLAQLKVDLQRLAHDAWDYNVVVACLLAVSGFALDTGRDVRSWQRSRGSFVWPATLQVGLRFAALLALIIVSPFLLAGLETVWGPFGESSGWLSQPIHYAWLAFGMLALADLGELLISAWLIRRSGSQTNRRGGDSEPQSSG